MKDAHGVPLIERVIEKVQTDGLHAYDTPEIERAEPLTPDVVDALRFPNGQQPSPSLRAWLAFDASWLRGLGWFRSGPRLGFAPRKLGAFAGEEYEDHMRPMFKSFERRLPGDVYLLPQGSDSRRALYVGMPDELGEHPVIVTDIDDLPYVGLMYPGFDVYMAALVGLIQKPQGTYESLHKDAVYGPRLAEHVKINFGGHVGYEWEGEMDDEGQPPESPKPPPAWNDGDPVPDGFVVLVNPFTKQKQLMRNR